jgi:hypothetical protein
MVKFGQDVLPVTNFWTAHVKMRQALAQLWGWSFTRFRLVNGPRNYWGRQSAGKLRKQKPGTTWVQK